MEGFQEKFIKKGIGSLAVYIVDLIKHVVCLGFPSSWSKHIIHRIFELGIFLTQIITRLLWLGIPLPNSILQSWACLSKHQGRNELIVEGQAGFRRDNETIDHLFTLCAIIEEAKQHSSKVFCCIVIFEWILTLCQRNHYCRAYMTFSLSQLLSCDSMRQL